MLNLLIRDLNLTLKPYGLQVIELPTENTQNPRSSAVLAPERPVPESALGTVEEGANDGLHDPRTEPDYQAKRRAELRESRISKLKQLMQGKV